MKVELLFQFGIVRVADPALMIAAMDHTSCVAEKRSVACAAVDSRRGGKFILRWSTDIGAASDYVADVVSVLLAGCQIDIQESRGFRRRPALFWRSQFC